MIPPSEQEACDPPLIDADPEATYTLEVVAELTGVSTQTILLYQEHGLLRSVAPHRAQLHSGALRFDLEALRALRRIEQLRSQFEMNVAGLRAMMQLLDEVERLQASLREKR